MPIGQYTCTYSRQVWLLVLVLSQLVARSHYISQEIPALGELSILVTRLSAISRIVWVDLAAEVEGSRRSLTELGNLIDRIQKQSPQVVRKMGWGKRVC